MPFIRHVSGLAPALAHAGASEPACALDVMAAWADAEGDAVSRAALFAAIAADGSAAAAMILARFLRSEHPAIRGAAIAGLKNMGDAACTAVDALLRDPDADLRLLGVEVMRAWPPEMAAPRLAHIIAGDSQANVSAAALDVAAQTGTTVLLPALARLRSRFGGLDHMRFAEEQSRLRIQARGLSNP